MVVSVLASHFKDWQAFVEGPATQADILLVLSLDNLGQDAGDGRAVKESKVAQWTEAHAKPLPIGLASSYVRSGGALSVSPRARNSPPSVPIRRSRVDDSQDRKSVV